MCPYIHICPAGLCRIVKHVALRRAERGGAGMRELMELTPCDVFPYLRGRTIWLVGDSMMQVQSILSGSLLLRQALHQTSIHVYMATPSGCSLLANADTLSMSQMCAYHSSTTVQSSAYRSPGKRCIGVLVSMPVSMTEGK